MEEAGLAQGQGRPAATGPVLRVQLQPPDGAATAEAADGTPYVRLIADPTWTRPDADVDRALIGLREVSARVLAGPDPFPEATRLLDAWVDAAGIVDAFTVDGSSYWYAWRIRSWTWLLERLLWSRIVDEVLEQVRPSHLECAIGTPFALIEAMQAAAGPAGLECRVEVGPPRVTVDVAVGPVAREGDGADFRPVQDPPRVDRPGRTPPGRRARAPEGPLLVRFTRRVVRRILRPLRPPPPPPPKVRERTQRELALAARLADLEAEPPRLLAIMAHARQLVDTPTGRVATDPYLGSVRQRLRDTALDPIEIDIRAHRDDAPRADGLIASDGRMLPRETLAVVAPEATLERARAEAMTIADRLAAITTPLMVRGIDLGPAMLAEMVRVVKRSAPNRLLQYRRARRLIARLRPRAIMLADEYHRQDWLHAASCEGIPSIAVQHGLIYRGHHGYIHAHRPESLRLPDRTYVFGRWERDLLLGSSVYREDEVRVGGSPRLDLVRAEPVDREGVREELGVADGDRLLVLSATWGTLYRTFYYPVALASLFDRPLSRVHLVIKLHPSEGDEGPYRAVIDGIARARGFAPPPTTVVRDIDLYRLLRAADAHLGIHSTVLTEAVFAGTPNLLADTFQGNDLLGYVEAGVARPVRTGGDVQAALDDPPDPAETEAARRRFIEAHFEPGSATERIANDVLAWLT